MSDIEIEEICKKYGIKNYTIKDGLVNVDDDVNLSNKRLTELPLKFGKVIGGFYCYKNNLTILEGSPSYVGGGFDCRYNRLISLEGSPRYVGDNFYCAKNLLTDLKGSPDEVVGHFHCDNNKIYSLDGLLFKRINIFNIDDNPIENLYHKYNLDDIYHREFLIEADVIRPPDDIGGLLAGRECVALPIINKDRMDWFTQTYGLKEFKGDKNYKLQ